MVATRWSFPNGSAGDALTLALAGADSMLTTGGTAVLESQPWAIGPAGLVARMTGTASGHLWFAKEGLTSTAYAVDLYVYIPTGSELGAYLIWAGSTASSRSASVELRTTGSLRLRAGSVDVVWDSQVLPVDTLLRVSMYVTCSETTGTIRFAWYLGHDSVPQEDVTFTGLNTNTVADRIRLGAKAATSPALTELSIASWAYDPVATDLIPKYEVPPVPDPEPLPGVVAVMSGSQAVSRISIGERMIWPWSGAAIRMTVEGSTFSPEIELLAFPYDGGVQWLSDGATVTGTDTAPTLTWPTGGEHLVTLVVNDDRDLVTLNLGFDHTQDGGQYNLGSGYDHTPQSVTSVRGLRGMRGLKNFMAASTQLTGELDLTGCASLEFVECFEAQVQSVLLEGCPSVVRLCLESTQIQYLDLGSVQDSIYDLRAANMQGGTLEFSPVTNLPNLYHYCVRTQSLVNGPTLEKMPVVEQWWVWGTNMVSPGTPVSPLLYSPLAHNNAFTQQFVDALLIHVNDNVSSPVGNVRTDGGTSAAPSTAGMAARDALVARGNWTVITN